MKYFKRNLNNTRWMYYRSSDGAFYDYWHVEDGWRPSLYMYRISIPPVHIEEVSRLEILVALGAEAVKENAVL